MMVIVMIMIVVVIVAVMMAVIMMAMVVLVKATSFGCWDSINHTSINQDILLYKQQWVHMIWKSGWPDVIGLLDTCSLKVPVDTNHAPWGRGEGFGVHQVFARVAGLQGQRDARDFVVAVVAIELLKLVAAQQIGLKY